MLNHVAREHEWAAKARAGEPAYRSYFHVHPDRTVPDAFEATLPEVFPDFAPGSFTWDEELRGWVWTTFNEWQWDLDWSNPEVMLEFADIILTLANLGVEVLRLDAVAFVWKRLGTSCQSQPEVHAVIQALRSVARLAAPALAFKAEAIVGPRDLVQYLGLGRHAGRISDLAYHNSLMVQVWSMLATGNTVLARHALAALPPTPSTAAWITYLRCHDDIGWAIDDGDAADVGLSGPAHRHFLADWYVGEFPGSWADGLVFQHNPETGDRRISGTAASLMGLADDPDGGLARMFLAHAVIAGWGGVPVVWSGDELGLPNDPGLGRRARPRGRQPLGAPAPPGLGPRGAAARPEHRGRQGLQRDRAPEPRARLAAAAPRVGVGPGADRHRRGRPRGGPQPRQRSGGLPLQRDDRAPAVPGPSPARGRPRGAVRRPRRPSGHRGSRRRGVAAGVRRVVGRGGGDVSRATPVRRGPEALRLLDYPRGT